ncbi:sensor histidine kinase [Sulfuricurvum sp.]|uniref:sensor histidine kinase n=1 Tax=Sulfuricurvum sp. TaxID=2025608 RepID=UPI00356488DB
MAQKHTKSEIKTEEGSYSKILRHQAEEVAKRLSALAPQNFTALSPEEMQRIFHELQVYQIEFEMQNEELRRTQVELHAERDRYRELYNMAPVGYCTLSKQGLILQANHTAAKLLGVTQSRLIKEPITRFILAEDQDIYYLYHKQFDHSDKSHSCELRMIRNGGVKFWAHLEATDGQATNISEYHLIISDITQYVQMREALKVNEKIMIAQSQKASMGELISMIGHQWRQPLNTIALINQDIYIKMRLGKLDDESIYSSHEKLDGILQFMSKTIDDFRNFFTPDQPKEEIKIVDALNNALKIIGQCFDNRSIAVHIQNNSKTDFLIHKNSLVQVFMNILNNSKYAIEANDVKPAAIMITINDLHDTTVITLCDNGGGIPETILDKIGQPYFTTKGVVGTGLGLYISQTIIEKYFAGTLTWYNNPSGACFVITLNHTL